MNIRHYLQIKEGQAKSNDLASRHLEDKFNAAWWSGRDVVFKEIDRVIKDGILIKGEPVHLELER
jgi:hypothetical protein